MSSLWVALLLILVAVVGLLVVAFTGDWVGKPPKRNIQVSPLLMNPPPNKYAVMNRMREVAEEHRSREVVIFPEDRDEEGA